MRLNGSTATVESQIPGRIRLRIPRERREARFVSRVRSVLQEVEGVAAVACNMETGSVLVNYDPDAVTGDRVIERGRRAGVVGDRPEPVIPSWCHGQWPQRSMMAESILHGFRRFDTTVCRITRGTVDGKMAVSLLLLGTSLGRALVAENRRPVPWHSLMWYAYSTFMHWHRPGGNGQG